MFSEKTRANLACEFANFIFKESRSPKALLTFANFPYPTAEQVAAKIAKAIINTTEERTATPSR